MTSFMALDSATLFLCLKDVTITCKTVRRSLGIGDSSSVQWGKVGEKGKTLFWFFVSYCVLESK